ncbi:MAG: ankyrin repeat domain-containing protein [Magnetococcales bacterium]|nr:ankyrin repeat domain-containing protein [Magnetococcales bacterium]
MSFKRPFIVLVSLLVASLTAALPSQSEVDPPPEPDRPSATQQPAMLEGLVDDDRMEPRDLLDRTPLIRAVQEGQIGLVREILSRGGSVTARDRWGRNALSHALARDERDMVDLLIHHGATLHP